jgi:hypothetical protein
MIAMRRILVTSKHLCLYDSGSYRFSVGVFNMIMFNM